MKEPVDHILRPRLPWRGDDGAITECGYDATKVKSLTREEFRARLKDLGQQRTATLTCMTCSQTSSRYATWEDNPRQAVDREVVWESSWGRDIKGREQRLKDELFVIADLIEAHREEFDAAIIARQGRRDWLEKKAAAHRKPKPATLIIRGL